MNRLISALLLAFCVLTPSTSQTKTVSGIYVGGHIRRERPKTITTLKESGFTYVILFNVHVDKDGTLMTDGETICKDGQYVFHQTQPHYVEDIRALKEAPTSIQRIEICIGGWGNDSYDHIRDLINANGTGKNTILYRNFKALLDAVPGIDAVNNDDEHCYDVTTATKFHIMMYNLGLKTTLAPYMNKGFWTELATNVNQKRRGAVDRVMIQCYDGGAGNDPRNWTFNGITRHAGRTNYQTDMKTSIAQMETWKGNGGAEGGFVWVYNDETWDLNAWGAAINRTYGAMTVNEEETAAEVFSNTRYAGYSVALPVGEYTKADMALYGIQANDIESVKVKEGYTVTLYTTKDFKGVKRIAKKDYTSLGTLNNLINSIKVEKNETSAIEMTAQQQITLKCDGTPSILYAQGKMIQIFNTAGLCVKTYRITSDHEPLDMNALPHGTYIIKVEKNTWTFAY